MSDKPPISIAHGQNISWIILDRPHAANAFSGEMLDQFSAALEKLKREGKAIIGIRGSGKGFSAGADLSEYNAAITPVEDLARLQTNLDRWLAIWRHPKPVIVAIHGFCMGIAAQLASFADLTIVAEDARISEPGLPLGGGYVAPTWTVHVGVKRAKEFAFLPGNFIDGRTAADWGWANAAVPEEQLIACAEAMADRMALIPAAILTVKKQSINRAAEAAGFLQATAAIAESDAILHLEPSVLALRQRIADEGLKPVLQDYRGPSSQDIFKRCKGS